MTMYAISISGRVFSFDVEQLARMEDRDSLPVAFEDGCWPDRFTAGHVRGCIRTWGLFTSAAGAAASPDCRGDALTEVGS